MGGQFANYVCSQFTQLITSRKTCIKEVLPYREPWPSQRCPQYPYWQQWWGSQCTSALSSETKRILWDRPEIWTGTCISFIKLKSIVWGQDQKSVSVLAHQELGKQAHLTSRLKGTAFGPQQNIFEVQFDVTVDVRHGGDPGVATNPRTGR